MGGCLVNVFVFSPGSTSTIDGVCIQLSVGIRILWIKRSKLSEPPVKAREAHPLRIKKLSSSAAANRKHIS